MANEVETKEIPLDQATAEEYNKARDEGKSFVTREKLVEEPVKEEKTETVENEEAKEEPKADDKPKKNGGGFQNRIDRLVKEKSELQRRAEEAERKAAELEGKAPKKEEPKPNGAPKQEDFTDYETFIVAKAKYELKEELRIQQEAEEQEEENAKIKEIFDGHNNRVTEARAKYEDFDEVVNESVKIPWKDGNKADVMVSQAFQIALYESPLSGEILYHYGKHPEELLKLGDLTASGVQKAVGRLEARLEAELGTETEETEETEQQEEPKPVKRESRAPLPIKPVNGGSTKSSIPLDKMDPIAFNKAREAGRVR